MKKWCSLLVLFILIFSIIDLSNTNGVSYAKEKDNEVSGRAVSNNFFVSLVHSLKNIFSGTVGQDFTRDPIAAKDLRLTRENNNVILYWNEEINQITGRSIFSTSFDVVKKFFNNLFGKVGNIPEPGPELPPSAPYNLRAFALSDTQIRLTWEIDQLSENINIESGFKIERRQVGASDENFIQIIVVGPGVTSYQDTNLNPSTTYEYRVRAYNNYGNSPYSNTAQATTLSTQLQQYVLGYRIYRIKSDNGENIVDKIITNTREDFQCDRLLTGCNYRDENLPPGDYKYFVKGVLIYQDRLEEGYTISNIVDVTIEQSQGSSGSDGGRTGRRSRTGSGTTGSGTVCSEQWLCGSWGSCINNIQRRSCIDLNNCNNVVPKVNKPSETRSCTTVRAPFGEDQFEQGEEQAGEIQGVLQNKMVRQIITIAVIILALLFLLFLGLRTNIFNKKEDNYYRIYKEVINSVKLAKKQGFSDNEIIKELKNKGWTYEQIKDIMKRV